ncbi:CD209 antigen-like protein D [Mytilus trossulus]|uniref:CD209 antigen-like protein D n=1 Tax=Mytilus trossulus TaxID=6551 RepID=UPI003007AA89
MFNSTLLGIILFGTFSQSFSSLFTCSEGWNLQGSKCYKVDQEKRNFTNSKIFCEKLNAEIIMPKTAEEISVLSVIGNFFWIGLLIDHDKTITRNWKWNDGTELESSDRWSPGMFISVSFKNKEVTNDSFY